MSSMGVAARSSVISPPPGRRNTVIHLRLISSNARFLFFSPLMTVHSGSGLPRLHSLSVCIGDCSWLETGELGAVDR
jgi:hypothetical protein